LFLVVSILVTTRFFAGAKRAVEKKKAIIVGKLYSFFFDFSFEANNFNFRLTIYDVLLRIKLFNR
jgi:hypothetical protein